MTTRLEPSPQHSVVEADDGFALAVRVYPARGSTRATLLVHSATAVPQGYYARFATHMSEHGLRVVTYDYRGVGGSRPASLRGLGASMTDWATLDAAAVVRWVARRWSEPTILVGHSFGGQLLGLIDEASEVDAAVFVGAQLGYMGHWPAQDRPKLALMWYGLVPALTTTVGFLPAWSGLGEELPAGVAREWAKWCRSPNYFLDHVPAARARLARFDRPVLALGFDDDDFAPRPAIDAFLRELASADIDYRHISPEAVGAKRIGHFGFFRAAFESSLWPEVTSFVDRVLGSAASRSAA